jgi:hypothetical protein
MPYWGHNKPNRSYFFREIANYFRGRGITSHRKITELTYRWIRQKGYRLPQ